MKKTKFWIGHFPLRSLKIPFQYFLMQDIWEDIHIWVYFPCIYYVFLFLILWGFVVHLFSNIFNIVSLIYSFLAISNAWALLSFLDTCGLSEFKFEIFLAYFRMHTYTHVNYAMNDLNTCFCWFSLDSNGSNFFGSWNFFFYIFILYSIHSVKG